jgi:hypothetical protein
MLGRNDFREEGFILDHDFREFIVVWPHAFWQRNMVSGGCGKGNCSLQDRYKTEKERKSGRGHGKI